MSERVTIGPATFDEAEPLAALAVECYVAAFGHSFSAADLAAQLAQRLSVAEVARFIAEDLMLVARSGERLVGFVQVGMAHLPEAAAGDQELRRLYVHPAFQNQGIGARLMEAALAHPRTRGAARLFLDVWEHNHGARRFYERYGFEVIGTRRFEVESGAETSLDLIMVRRSPSPENR